MGARDRSPGRPENEEPHKEEDTRAIRVASSFLSDCAPLAFHVYGAETRVPHQRHPAKQGGDAPCGKQFKRRYHDDEQEFETKAIHASFATLCHGALLCFPITQGAQATQARV